MDDWELAIKLRKERGIEEVWNGHAFLTLDENRVPILETWYQLEQNGERIDEIYKFIYGKWVLDDRQPRIYQCPECNSLVAIIGNEADVECLNCNKQEHAPKMDMVAKPEEVKELPITSPEDEEGDYTYCPHIETSNNFIRVPEGDSDFPKGEDIGVDYCDKCMSEVYLMTTGDFCPSGLAKRKLQEYGIFDSSNERGKKEE